MKKESYQGVPAAELQQKLAAYRAELWQSRQQVAAQQLKNYRKIREKRRQIARILTELNAKEGVK